MAVRVDVVPLPPDLTTPLPAICEWPYGRPPALFRLRACGFARWATPSQAALRRDKPVRRSSDLRSPWQRPRIAAVGEGESRLRHPSIARLQGPELVLASVGTKGTSYPSPGRSTEWATKAARRTRRKVKSRKTRNKRTNRESNRRSRSRGRLSKRPRDWCRFFLSETWS